VASHSHQSAAVTWLLLTSALIQSDQNLLAPNLSACAQEFALTPQEKDEKLGGLLAAALFLVGAPAALLIGAAADGAARRIDLLALLLLLGGLGCLGSSLAGSFWQLFAARALTGVSLGGGLPVTYSLVGGLDAGTQICAFRRALEATRSLRKSTPPFSCVLSHWRCRGAGWRHLRAERAGVPVGKARPAMSLGGGLGQSRLISARSRRRLGLAMSLGGMTGQLLAGLLGPRLGWRAPFVPIGGLVVVEAEYLKVRILVLQPGLERRRTHARL